MARQQSYSLWIRSMQVPLGSHWDFDLDWSPIVVAVGQGCFIFGDNMSSSVSINPTESSLILRVKEQNKVRWYQKLYDTEIKHSAVWRCSSLLLFGLHRCLPVTTAEGRKVTLLLFLLLFTQNHKTYQSWRVTERIVKPRKSVFPYPHTDLLWLKTGNGPSRPAMRRGWWGSRGIPYCFLWRGLRLGPLPWPSEPVPRHPARPAPPDCPCWSPGYWGEGCGRAMMWWRRATEGDRRGFLPGCRGTVVRPRRQRSRRSAPRCWSCRRRSRKARWCGRDLTAPGRLWRRYQHEGCKEFDTSTVLSTASALYSCYISIPLSAFMSTIYCASMMWITQVQWVDDKHEFWCWERMCFIFFSNNGGLYACSEYEFPSQSLHWVASITTMPQGAFSLID